MLMRLVYAMPMVAVSDRICYYTVIQLLDAMKDYDILSTAGKLDLYDDEEGGMIVAFVLGRERLGREAC